MLSTCITGYNKYVTYGNSKCQSVVPKIYCHMLKKAASLRL